VKVEIFTVWFEVICSGGLGVDPLGALLVLKQIAFRRALPVGDIWFDVEKLAVKQHPRVRGIVYF